MPRRKTELINGEFYHIIERGNDRRKIFLDNEDRLRFVNSLLVFNDTAPSPWQSRAFWKKQKELLKMDYKPKNPLVEIHAFALMDNHFHILVRQLTENGITNYTRKLGGYAYYFNKKHKRTGSLFEGRFRAKLIQTEVQLRNNFVYIKTNPVEMVEPEWKSWKVVDSKQATDFLEKDYRWSSYWDYLGKNNFSSLVKKDFFLKLFDGEQNIQKEINSWISSKSSVFSRGMDKVDFLE
ncbi:transposase [Patescibacteria group bacterium]|nr:transposase [Patescibacteria group bacterium]MBU4162349.1 transposase [Patescibacteria group bacterium]